MEVPVRRQQRGLKFEGELLWVGVGVQFPCFLRADGGALVNGLRWTSWTAASATAVGTLVYNDCSPDCAEGHQHDVPGARVTLTAPVRGAGGQTVWSRVQEKPEPPGYQTGPLHGAPQPLPTRPA